MESVHFEIKDSLRLDEEGLSAGVKSISCDSCGTRKVKSSRWVSYNATVWSATTSATKEIKLDVCPGCRRANVSVEAILSRRLEAEALDACPVIDREKVCLCDDEEEVAPRYINEEFVSPLAKEITQAPVPRTPFEDALEPLLDHFVHNVDLANANVLLPDLDAWLQKIHPLFLNSSEGTQVYRTWREFVKDNVQYFTQVGGRSVAPFNTFYRRFNSPFDPENS